MSVVTVKSVKKTFLDFVDIVDPEDEESEQDITATADKEVGTCTWPVFCLRQRSGSSTEEGDTPQYTPENDGGEPSDICETLTPADAGSTPADAGEPVAQTLELGSGVDETEVFGSFGVGELFLEAREVESWGDRADSPSAAGFAGEHRPPTADPESSSPTWTWHNRAASFYNSPYEGQGSSHCSASDPVKVPLGVADEPSPAEGVARGLPALSRASLAASPWPMGVWPAPGAPSHARVALPLPSAQVAKVRVPSMRSEGAQRQQRFQREDPNRLERRRHPAKRRADDEQAGPREPLEERTTIMLRNIPNNYSRDMLLQLLHSRGFGGKCNFVYVPMDFHTQCNLGYAFVNLEEAEDAQRFWQVFEGFSKWAVRSKKVGSLRWSECQGLEANIKRYRNSPVMNEAVPDCHKPAVFAGGARIEFPAPTKTLRAPRIKQIGLR